MEEHPRKGEGRDGRSSSFRKPPPFFVVVLRALALSIIVIVPCALLAGIGARLAYELFEVGWNLFGY